MLDLSISDIFSILRKWLWLILIVPILCAALAGVYFYRYLDDTYTAKTSLYVLIRYEDASGNLRYDTASSNSFTSDYQEIFARSPVMENTATKLGIQSIGSAASMSVKSVPNTRIVEVSATGKDPAMCAEIVNTASQIFKEYIEAFMKVDSVSIIQLAKVPTGPSGPPRVRNTALVFAVSMMLCIIFVLGREILNTRITSTKQIEEGLDKPLLGSVYDYRRELGAFLEKEKAAVNILYDYVSPPVRESLKTVAVNIGFSSVDHPLRSIAFTSATPNEGKSSLAVMVATAYAEEGKRTLVVDTDFRKPSVGRILKRRNRMDLMDYLAGTAKINDVIVKTSYDNLYFIDSSHSVAMLSTAVSSDRFDHFLSLTRAMFDIVIFDTPPLGMFIDAAVLSSKLDGAVMVIANNMVEMKGAKDVIEQLNKSGANTRGVVLNYVKQPKNRGAAYYRKYERRERDEE